MTKRANTPEKVVRQWIAEAQRNARRMEYYQRALDAFTAGVKEHITRLEAYSARLSTHERVITKTLKTYGFRAGKG